MDRPVRKAWSIVEALSLGFPHGTFTCSFENPRQRVLTSASNPALASALARAFTKNSQLWVLSLPFHSYNDDVTISGSYCSHQCLGGTYSTTCAL
jgi:hypothetical protein